METPERLFAYGTLGPRSEEESRRGAWEADAVRGRLFDLGPYPALVDAGDPRAGWVEGASRPVARLELERVLDPYEGVDAGLYRRRAVRSRSGRLVWVYEYRKPIPSDAPGPLPRWRAPVGGTF